MILCSLALALGGAPAVAQQAAPAPARAFATTATADKSSVQVHVDGQLVLEIKPGARLRMRCTTGADRWIGFEGHEILLGWAPNKHPAVDNVKVEVLESTERLKIAVSGTKPQLPGARFAATITGEFDGRGRVRYQLASELDLGPDNKMSSIEYLDLWYDRIFWPEKQAGTPELYQEFVYGTPAGVVRAPKLHVYTDTYTPQYPTTTLTQRVETGSFFAVVDPRYGGVINKIDHMSSGRGAVGVCWWAWDPHFFAYSRQPTSRFDYRMTIEDLDVEEANRLLKSAKPIDLAAEPAYQLPVFVVDGVNEFDRYVRTPRDWAWERSSTEVSVDTTVGFRDAESATIRRTTPGKAAWFGRQLWVDPWKQRMLEGRHRLTAMVKTKDVAGGAHISIVQYPLPSQMLYHVASPVTVTSKQVSGTTEWAELSVDFDIKERNAFAVLEQIGEGQTWFDDVRIVPLCDPVDGGAPRVAFHARDDVTVSRRLIQLNTCKVNYPDIHSSMGKLTMAWAESEARIPRMTLPPGRYQLVLFAAATGCPDDPARLRVDGVPGVAPTLAIRPNATDDYVVEFTLDRRLDLDVALRFVNDGPCGAGIDRNIEVRAITLAVVR